MISVTFLPMQIKYPATRSTFQNFDKNGILIIKRYKQLTRLSVISGNIWYHLTWLMMLDIMTCVTFLPVQNEYPATRFICQNIDKNGILIIKSNMQLRRLSVMSGNIWYDLVCITLCSIIFYVTGYQQLTFFRSSSQLLVTDYQQLTFLQIKQPVTSNWLLVANFSW